MSLSADDWACALLGRLWRLRIRPGAGFGGRSRGRSSRGRPPVLHAEHLDGTTRNHHALVGRRYGLQLAVPEPGENRRRKDKIPSVIPRVGREGGNCTRIDDAVREADPCKYFAVRRTVISKDLPPGTHRPDSRALLVSKQQMYQTDGAQGEKALGQKCPQHEPVVLRQVRARGAEKLARGRHPFRADRADDGQDPQSETAEPKGGQDDSADLPEGRLRDASTSSLAEKLKQESRSDKKDKEKDRQPVAWDHRELPVVISWRR
jgi:hypothetical protein